VREPDHLQARDIDDHRAVDVLPSLVAFIRHLAAVEPSCGVFLRLTSCARVCVRSVGGATRQHFTAGMVLAVNALTSAKGKSCPRRRENPRDRRPPHLRSPVPAARRSTTILPRRLHRHHAASSCWSVV
jgi:hypothetical protein